MSIGTRRKGTFVRWNLSLSASAVHRADTFYSATVFNKLKPIYGYRSQLFTHLFTEWADKAETSFYGRGTRRHGSSQMIKVMLWIPQDLADRINQLAPAKNGPIFGFRSQLATHLLTKWCDAKEAELLNRTTDSIDPSALNSPTLL